MSKVFIALLALLLASPVVSDTISIKNSTGLHAIHEVYIYPNTSAIRSGNWLEDGVFLIPGDSREFTVAAGAYHVEAVDEEGVSYSLWSVPVSGSWSWDITLNSRGYCSYSDYEEFLAGGLAKLAIADDIGRVSYPDRGGAYWADFRMVFIRPSWSEDWGADLGYGPTTPRNDTWEGAEITLCTPRIFYVPAGQYYDIMLVDNGFRGMRTYTKYDVLVGPNGFVWSVTSRDWDGGYWDY